MVVNADRKFDLEKVTSQYWKDKQAALWINPDVELSDAPRPFPAPQAP